MDVQNLAQQLRNPDPRARVEILRILAMIEETRALPAVRWIYKNDPESGVRDVADWTGRLLWAAHKRGHSTERALEELYNQPLSPEQQKRFLEAMERDIPAASNPKIQQYATEQAFHRQLTEIMQGTEEEEVPDQDEIPALPEQETPIKKADNLLDAGLTDLLLE